MQARDPDFASRVLRVFDKQPLMKTLNVSIESVEPGQVQFSMPHHAGATQQHGFIHGGCIAAILDSACGFSAQTLMDAEAEVLTVELKTNYLAPAKGDRYRFEGSVIKPGRTLMVTEAKAFAIDDNSGEDKCVALMLATMMVVVGRDDVKNT